MGEFTVVGESERKLDGLALVTGKPVFAGDLDLPDTLVMGFLRSPHPHARIAFIETSLAEALPGVACVLSHRNTPRTRFTTAGQSWPEPSPYDTRMFDTKVRFVGDPVAAVAAETWAVAAEALESIEVGYEQLPAVLSVDEAILDGAPRVHDEDDATDIWDAEHNTSAMVSARVGDLEVGFSESKVVVETTCETQYTQHASLEPHVVLSYLDENGRLVLYTSTQVPWHARRIVARVLDIPLHMVRVVKPRIGGGFGAKQEVILEPAAALATLRTSRPVLAELSREEEFYATRTRHPMRVRVKLGADEDGILRAIEMEALSNTGAYGTHGLTVLSNTGSKTLPLYNKAPHVTFRGRAVYTNLPVAGAFRGYGASQGYFGLETAMDELAEGLGMDPVALRRLNHIRAGESSPIFAQLGEGRPGVEQRITSCALSECLDVAATHIDWENRRSAPKHNGSVRRGIGMSVSMQGSGIPLVDMASASIRMNEDGSFHLAVGATDLGTGSDTVLGQVAAEVLGVPLDHIVVLSSDTDTTPFDVGAYASSTTYVSGTAVQMAASDLRDRVLEVAGEMLEAVPSSLDIVEGRVVGRDGGVDLAEVGLRALYVTNQRQLAATASFVPEVSPPPFLASFAEVEVDMETGEVKIIDFVAAADCGTPINPQLAEGQLEGAIAQGIGYALYEEMVFDGEGRLRNPDLARFKIPGILDMPPVHVILVDSYDPTGPMGAKSIAEIGINAPAPTIANAIYDAVGVRLRKTPFTAERVWEALQSSRRL